MTPALGAPALPESAVRAIIPRYTMLAAALLATLAAFALLGWRLLTREDSRRRRRQLAAAALAVLFPAQYGLDPRVATDLADQRRIEGDLHRLVVSGAFARDCGSISVPTTGRCRGSPSGSGSGPRRWRVPARGSRCDAVTSWYRRARS